MTLLQFPQDSQNIARKMYHMVYELIMIKVINENNCNLY